MSVNVTPSRAVDQKGLCLCMFVVVLAGLGAACDATQVWDGQLERPESGGSVSNSIRLELSPRKLQC